MTIIQKKQEEEYSFPYHYVSQFNENFTQSYNDTWGINYVATIEFILSKLALDSFVSLIDIGCGDGRLSDEIKKKFPDKTIMGIDYSKKAIALASCMAREVNFQCKDISKDDLTMSYDLALLIEVFEHIPLDLAEKFIFSVKNLLKPLGYLYITVPHKNKPLEYKHFQHFDIVSLEKYLSPYFKIDEIIFLEKKSLLKKMIDKILTNQLFILNNKSAKNFIYSFYKKKLFIATEENKCQRIFIKAIKK